MTAAERSPATHGTSDTWAKQPQRTSARCPNRETYWSVLNQSREFGGHDKRVKVSRHQPAFNQFPTETFARTIRGAQFEHDS